MSSMQLLLLCTWALSIFTVLGKEEWHLSNNYGMHSENHLTNESEVRQSFLEKAAQEERASLHFEEKSEGRRPNEFFPTSGRRQLFHTERNNHVFATVSTIYEASYLYVRGASANISVWRPTLGSPEKDFSRAFVWVAHGQPSEQTAIQVGWQVWPKRYQDDKPHLFIYTTNDSYTDVNCYDDDCHGTFVHTNNDIRLGMTLENSTVDGEIKEHKFLVEMKAEGDWSFQFDGVLVGHWPRSVLPRLNRGALWAEWGGEVTTFSRGHRGAFPDHQMGNGKFPWEHRGKRGFRKLANFKDLQIKPSNHPAFRTPPRVIRHQTKPGCYALGWPVADYNDVQNGHAFSYGGYGGKAKFCEKGPYVPRKPTPGASSSRSHAAAAATDA